MEEQHEVLTLIEEITRNDGSKYYEIGNMVQNGRAELAAERGYIKEVLIFRIHEMLLNMSILSTLIIRCRMNQWTTGKNGSEHLKLMPLSKKF